MRIDSKVRKDIMSTKTHKGPGRPKKEVTPAQMRKAEGYALDGCQNGTIEGLMDWPNQFIEKHKDIAKKLTKKRQERKLVIRQAQNKQLNTPVMAIWLGKNDLDQADKQETKLSGAVELLAPSVSMLK